MKVACQMCQPQSQLSAPGDEMELQETAPTGPAIHARAARMDEPDSLLNQSR